MREIAEKHLPLAVCAIILVLICFFIRPAAGVMLFTSIGLSLIIGQLLYVRKIRKNGTMVMGHIISYQDSGNDYTVPCIEFTTLENETISGQPYISSSIEISGIRPASDHSLHEVRVIYNPDKPADFLLPDHLGQHLLAFSVIFLGFLFLLVLSICDLSGRSVF